MAVAKALTPAAPRPPAAATSTAAGAEAAAVVVTTGAVTAATPSGTSEPTPHFSTARSMAVLTISTAVSPAAGDGRGDLPEWSVYPVGHARAYRYKSVPSSKPL